MPNKTIKKVKKICELDVFLQAGQCESTVQLLISNALGGKR